MLFNSADFVYFFPLVVALYFATPARFRWALLLAASYYFYACWRVEYLALIIASTLVDYGAALGMAASPTRGRRRLLLGLSLLVNLGLLFTFKYANFASQSVQLTFDRFNILVDTPTFDVLLPVGISFYTFQTLSYTIDVYRGEREPERNLGIFALYVAFFPQLVAGPIERSTRLLPQFRRVSRFDYDRFTSGLQQMGWGFFKKLVIADRASEYVTTVYGLPDLSWGPAVLAASYFFAFQIYCDFSGYSDIAIGSARILGYDLMENFRSPYFARSVGEFWRRWHISLSTWFRDYVYIPLGGNRLSRLRTNVNVFIVFVVSGLWHGANFTFVAWGALHGVYLIVENATASSRDLVWERGLGRVLGRAGALLRCVWAQLLTFHLVVVGWVFFRAEDMTHAGRLFRGLVQNWHVGDLDLIATGIVPTYRFIALVAAISLLLVLEAMDQRVPVRDRLARASTPLRWSFYYTIILLTIVYGKFSASEFLYFQF